jgi:predicted AAA+ superfamily ATPase
VRGEISGLMWPATGRLTRLGLYGLTVRELLGKGGTDRPTFLDRLADGETPQPPPDPPDLRGYLEHALLGGFPEPALRLGSRGRRAWYEGYIGHALTHDVEQTGRRADSERLLRYFDAILLSTATTVADKTLYQAAGISRPTASQYDALLHDLMLVEPLPAWSSNRIKRLTRKAKRHVVEPAFLASRTGLDVAAALRDGEIMGRLLESFVLAQLRAELVATERRFALHHLHAEQGRHEVDILAEVDGQGLIAFEVKAAAAPKKEHARHLIWLRDQLPDRFLVGAVLHTGPRSFVMDDKILALPIAALWG